MIEESYLFTCDKPSGCNMHSCNGGHIFKFNYDFCVKLIHRTIFEYELSVNKRIILELIDEFENFLKEKHELNKKGEFDISHFYTMDIEAELLFLFTDIKFGQKIQQIKNKQ